MIAVVTCLNLNFVSHRLQCLTGKAIILIGLLYLQVTDLHRHFIDHITIPSKQGKGELRRVEEVFDCWFESGSMPYGQLHYPFENKDFFESNFPADFVAEGALFHSVCPLFLVVSTGL